MTARPAVLVLVPHATLVSKIYTAEVRMSFLISFFIWISIRISFFQLSVSLFLFFFSLFSVFSLISFARAKKEKSRSDHSVAFLFALKKMSLLSSARMLGRVGVRFLAGSSGSTPVAHASSFSSSSSSSSSALVAPVASVRRIFAPQIDIQSRSTHFNHHHHHPRQWGAVPEARYVPS